MPIRPCPNCAAQTPRVLEGASENAYVWYYRCERCLHIWTLDKRDDTRITHVTPLKRRPEANDRLAE